MQGLTGPRRRHKEITMHTAILNEDTGLAMKLKTRHFAVLGVTATFLAIRLLENLVPTLAG
ncbi:hypothetical protein CEJ45_16425 [Herbaspirillum aquaticum]|jgi:hypothetical protein|uniref:Uncharacterized protein n=1 Tax=Herbaspirillum aquaticum TaxID=568783 RepID=A0A225SR62_9BURK|nr:hypothetical protein CEJ45_16425 [Herbaspirillum aquaticum]